MGKIVQGEDAGDLRAGVQWVLTGRWMRHGEKRGGSLKKEHLCCWLLCVQFPLPQLLRLCIL